MHIKIIVSYSFNSFYVMLLFPKDCYLEIVSLYNFTMIDLINQLNDEKLWNSNAPFSFQT